MENPNATNSTNQLQHAIHQAPAMGGGGASTPAVAPTPVPAQAGPAPTPAAPVQHMNEPTKENLEEKLKRLEEENAKLKEEHAKHTATHGVESQIAQAVAPEAGPAASAPGEEMMEHWYSWCAKHNKSPEEMMEHIKKSHEANGSTAEARIAELEKKLAQVLEAEQAEANIIDEAPMIEDEELEALEYVENSARELSSLTHRLMPSFGEREAASKRLYKILNSYRSLLNADEQALLEPNLNVPAKIAFNLRSGALNRVLNDARRTFNEKNYKSQGPVWTDEFDRKDGFRKMTLHNFTRLMEQTYGQTPLARRKQQQAQATPANTQGVV